jgi:hypothetical protein
MRAPTQSFAGAVAHRDRQHGAYAQLRVLKCRGALAPPRRSLPPRAARPEASRCSGPAYCCRNWRWTASCAASEAPEGAPIALVEGPVQRRVLHSVNAGSAHARLAARAGARRGAGTEHAFRDVRTRPGRGRALARFARRVGVSLQLAGEHRVAACVVLEVGPACRLFGPWPRFEARLREELHALGFRHRIVAAPNPHAARVLANVHDGLAIDEHALDTHWASCPNAAGCRSRWQRPRRRCRAWACAGCGRCSRCRARAGATFRQRLLAPRPPARRRGAVAAVSAAGRFDLRIEFDYEVEPFQALLFPLRRLAPTWRAFLAGRDGGVQRFTLVLEHERCADSEVVVGLLAPSAMRRCCSNWRGRLEQARIPGAGARLRLVARELPPFVPAGARSVRRAPAQACRGRNCANACARAWATTRCTARAIRRPSPGTGVARTCCRARNAADARRARTWLLHARFHCATRAARARRARTRSKAAGGMAATCAAITTSSQTWARGGSAPGCVMHAVGESQSTHAHFMLHGWLRMSRLPARPTPSCTACRTSASARRIECAANCSSARSDRATRALAITDECSLAGIVRALEASRSDRPAADRRQRITLQLEGG